MSSLPKPNRPFDEIQRSLKNAIPEWWESKDLTSAELVRVESVSGAILQFEDRIYPNRFRWRLVHMISPDSESLRVLAFPLPEVIVPIFSLELSRSNHELGFVSLDLPPTDRTTKIDSHLILDATHKRFPRIINNSTTIKSNAGYLSEQAILIHPDKPVTVTQLQGMIEFVWHRLLLVHARVVTFPRLAEPELQVANFKTKGMASCFERPMLSQHFGDEFSEQFITHHLFA